MLNRIYVLALIFLASSVHGDLVIFEYRGVVPSGSSHTFVSCGETFKAEFLVDPTIDDQDPDDSLGCFLNAVVVGKLEFSNGFKSKSRFNGTKVVVGNDGFGVDGVVVNGDGTPVFSSLTEDLDALGADSIPMIGTYLDGQAPDSLDPAIAFRYSDEHGSIVFSWGEGATTSLTVKDFVLGDANCDSFVDILDIAPFVEYISSGSYEIKADVNMDGTVDLLDVAPFVDLLTGE